MQVFLKEDVAAILGYRYHEITTDLVQVVNVCVEHKSTLIKLVEVKSRPILAVAEE